MLSEPESERVAMTVSLSRDLVDVSPQSQDNLCGTATERAAYLLKVTHPQHVRPTNLHFLESLDSTRMTWARLVRSPDDAINEWRAHEVNLLFEVLVSLAFGRTIAVPAPYAFDSLGFMRVASKVLRARDEVASGDVGDRPFRLCLFGGSTFEAMISRMLARIADQETPFRSSLFPELHQLSPDTLMAVAHDPDLIRAHVSAGSSGVDFDRFVALDQVREEFRLTPSITGRPNGDAPLNGILAAFANRAPRTGQTDSISLETHGRLQSSIRAMLTRQPHLDVRTVLHSEFWPGSQRIRTDDVVGGPTELRLVREFTDTAYNCLLSRSAATPTGLFTTPGISDSNDRDIAGLSTAQDLAIVEFSARFPDTLPSSWIGGSAGTLAGASGSVILVTDRMSKAHLAADLAEATSVLTAAITSVLTQRDDRTSDFWQSVEDLDSTVDRIDNATPTKEEPRGSLEARRAFDNHVSLLSDLFGSRLETTQNEGRELSIGLITGGATTYFSGVAGASPLWPATLGMIAGAAPFTFNKFTQGWQAHSTRKRWSQFLGTSVAFSQRH